VNGVEPGSCSRVWVELGRGSTYLDLKVFPLPSLSVRPVEGELETSVRRQLFAGKIKDVYTQARVAGGFLDDRLPLVVTPTQLGGNQRFNPKRFAWRYRTDLMIESPNDQRRNGFILDITLDRLRRRIEYSSVVEGAGELEKFRMSPHQWHSGSRRMTKPVREAFLRDSSARPSR
jgi:hypothetical protein